MSEYIAAARSPPPSDPTKRKVRPSATARSTRSMALLSAHANVRAHGKSHLPFHSWTTVYPVPSASRHEERSRPCLPDTQSVICWLPTDFFLNRIERYVA